MFIIKIAELRILIENRYDFVRSVCDNYIADGEDFDFRVSVSDNELETERKLSGEQFSDGFIESVCIYRAIAREIPRYDAFVIHCAAVEYDGNAYCFMAKSGVGKTTHINLWKKLFGDKVRYINGDKPIFRFMDGKIFVFGTPWGGKEGLHSNVYFPLGSICFIERSETNEIESISSHNALNKLLNQIFLPDNNEYKFKTLDFVGELISKTPIYNLKCNISDEAAKLSFGKMINKV